MIRWTAYPTSPQSDTQPLVSLSRLRVVSLDPVMHYVPFSWISLVISALVHRVAQCTLPHTQAGAGRSEPLSRSVLRQSFLGLGSYTARSWVLPPSAGQIYPWRPLNYSYAIADPQVTTHSIPVCARLRVTIRAKDWIVQ